ncbi:phosphatase PAP2 family protein [Leclercia sp. UBA5958]|uniref:phosphatase PAP2 family protein n=1 Tax=Leclercia sp. UBA5958 TaxID=1946742 RepID=UPI002580033A|nr:phosphatase PAP2 family protein [Leclercia sp. UBA5958]
MNAIKPRLWHMLLGWGAVGVAYALSDRLQGKGYHLTPMAIDSSIPFSPSAIWLYLSFFLLVPLGYLLVPRDRLRWLTCAMQLSALGAGVIYLLWPTTLHYPTYSSDGSASQLLTWLISVDSPQNCFPSLHAALTLLSVWAIAARRQGVLTVASLVWALTIGYSILQLRRHLFIDLLGGGMLAWGCGWLALHLERRRTLHRERINE